MYIMQSCMFLINVIIPCSYCGHGAGQGFINKDDVQRSPRAATSLLIGCSSGHLVEAGQSDPSGIALNYLTAGR